MIVISQHACRDAEHIAIVVQASDIDGSRTRYPMSLRYPGWPFLPSATMIKSPTTIRQVSNRLYECV